MLTFIFDDPRHGGAKRVSDKISIAMLITIEFIWHKLIDAFHWILAGLLFYACVLLFYTNALLSYTIFMTQRGLVAIAELAVAIVCIFIFATFALVMAIYFLSAVMRLIPAPAGLARAAEGAADEKSRWSFLVKPLGYATKAMGAARSAFEWRSSGRYWKTTLVLLLSVALYFHHWQAVKGSQSAIRTRDFMPRRVMQDSKHVHEFLWPYVDSAIAAGQDYLKPWLKSRSGGRGR
jgi:hypothetical protein